MYETKLDPNEIDSFKLRKVKRIITRINKNKYKFLGTYYGFIGIRI